MNLVMVLINHVIWPYIGHCVLQGFGEVFGEVVKSKLSSFKTKLAPNRHSMTKIMSVAWPIRCI